MPTTVLHSLENTARSQRVFSGSELTMKVMAPDLFPKSTEIFNVSLVCGARWPVAFVCIAGRLAPIGSVRPARDAHILVRFKYGLAPRCLVHSSPMPD